MRAVNPKTEVALLELIRDLRARKEALLETFRGASARIGERLDAAERALKAGQPGEALDELEELLTNVEREFAAMGRALGQYLEEQETDVQAGQ